MQLANKSRVFQRTGLLLRPRSEFRRDYEHIVSEWVVVQVPRLGDHPHLVVDFQPVTMNLVDDFADTGMLLARSSDLDDRLVEFSSWRYPEPPAEARLARAEH